MSISRKYHKSSLYYPDDKDIFDFLTASSASTAKLRLFLLGRGVYLSRNARAEDYYRYIGRLPLSWSDLIELVDLVDLAEKKEKSTFADYNYAGAFTSVSEAFELVSNERTGPEKETYKISQKDGIVIVDVDYIDIDNSKTPMLQGRPATLRIEVKSENGALKVTHTSNDTASEVLKSFEAQLSKLNKDEAGKVTDIVSSRISLKSILDAKLRVTFFTKLIRSLKGFDYNTTTNVKVARMPKNVATDEDKGEEKIDEEEEQKIKNVIIQGINIQDTPQYKELLESGFFISNITWESIEQESKDKVSFSAGFKHADTGEGFEYKINFRCVSDGGIYDSKDKVLPMKYAEYNELIQQASSASYETIKASALAQPTEPAEGDSK